jgi:F-type H+-transporting ATPase subunit b
MRSILLGTSLVALPAFPLLGQEPAAGGGSLMSLQINVMFWTLVIFFILLYILSKLAFKPITAMVEAREQALEEALAAAKRDRDEAAKMLADQHAGIDAARAEVQKLIAEGRLTGEKLRTDLVEKARAEQQEMLERAKREIEREKERAIIELRREAVEMAIAGAGKVIEQNLDSENNRKLVEAFLATLEPAKAKR